MPIKTTRENLAKPAGFPPTAHPIIIERFAEQWLRNLLESGYDDYPSAIPELPYRASWAGKRCDRQLYYALRSEPISDPMTVGDYWRMNLGTGVHHVINDTLRHLGDGWIPDIDVDLRPIGIEGSAHADLVRFIDHKHEPWVLVDQIDDEFWLYQATMTEPAIALRIGEWDRDEMIPTHCAEIKSINGFSYKQCASTQNGPPEGPRSGAIIQGCLSAAALGLDTAIIVNLSLELANARWVRNELERFAAEWHIGNAKAVAEQEAKRVRRIIALAAQDTLPARELHDQPNLPSGAVVTRPANGHWEVRDGDAVLQVGSTWHCDYCSMRAKCVADGDGRPS